MWQDTAIAICQLFFLPAMWPTLKGTDKPAFSTCLMNALIVAIISFCLASLHLWLAFSTAALTAIIWSVLAVQKFHQDRQVPAVVAADDIDTE